MADRWKEEPRPTSQDGNDRRRNHPSGTTLRASGCLHPTRSCRMSHQDIVREIELLYASLKSTPPPRQYTVLAAFILVDTNHDKFKIISLATGSKCLPASRLPHGGDTLHDSHAEVLARRDAVRCFMEEIGRIDPSIDDSPWFIRSNADLFALKNHIQVILYISTVPCETCISISCFPCLKQSKAVTRPLAIWQPIKILKWRLSRTRPNFQLCHLPLLQEVVTITLCSVCFEQNLDALIHRPRCLCRVATKLRDGTYSAFRVLWPRGFFIPST